MKKILLVLLLQIFFINTFAQNIDSSKSELYNKLKSLPDVADIKVIKPDSSFKEAYEIMIRQNLDHQNPKSKTFLQRIFLSSKDFSKPMVLITEGYETKKNFTDEPTKLLNANQILAENRFFGKSIPDSLNWKYLTAKQVAEDLHHIVEIFKKIYNGKWTSTGRSKGGQTCLFFRYFYPNDVDATIAYVAPLNPMQENSNINNFIENEVGTKQCREKITKFQIEVLKNRKGIIPRLKRYSEENNYKYSIGINKAFEYSVLEYPFSFWQWGKSSCDEIPDSNLTAEKLFGELKKVSSFNLYTDKEIKYLYPLFYQSFHELGYYNFKYNPTKVTKLLKYVKVLSNKAFAPKNVKIKYDPSLLKNMMAWLKNDGEKIMYIYGGNDPWSSANIDLNNHLDSFKFVKKGGNHAVYIKDFSLTWQRMIYNILDQWLDVKIN